MKPPLALSAVSIAADGSETTWWSGDKYAAKRPQQLSFRTRIGEGFSDAGCTLARRIDQDYNDLELYNDLVLVGDDGQIAYEGRISSTPRSTSGGHSIQVQSAGWMSHAKDQKFREIYVDRDLSAWGPMSPSRRADRLTASVDPSNASVATDVANSTPAVVCTLQGAWTRTQRIEGWYDAGPEVLLSAITYEFAVSSNVNPATANYTWGVALASDDAAGAITDSGDLSTGSTGSGTFDPGAARRNAFVYFDFSGAGGADGVQWDLYWKNLAVYGDHGLTRRAIGTVNSGFYASDVIADIVERFCPKLNTAGVEDTTLVIPHIVFKNRTTPFDALLLLNGPHGYELAVWEDKTLYFRPYDLSDYDWQVRMDQPGVDLSAQGDTTDQLANYVVVEFDNIATGQRDQVTPSDDSSLEDTTVDHPANTHGLDVELTIGLTFPTTREVAIAFGQSYLAEFNRPKNRGQITVQGHILDAAGHWIQPWMVRAGQTISVVDHPNDSPRLITETSYDHSSRTVTISTDNGELNQLDAVVDYIKTSLAASNL